MLNKSKLLRRLLVLLLVVLLGATTALARLADLQIVHGMDNVRRAAVNLTTTATVSAARGEILDRYGRPMVINRTAFSLVLLYSAWPTEGQYERLLELARLVEQDGATLCDDLPITKTAPFAYTEQTQARRRLSTYMKDSTGALGLSSLDTALEAAKTKQSLTPRKDEEGNTIDEQAALDATEVLDADTFIRAMRTYLESNKELPAGLSDEQARTLIGLYYSMRTRGFSLQVTFTLADGVSLDLIAYLKEHSEDFPGVEIEAKAVRRYETTLAAHLLGQVGPIYREEWEDNVGGGPYRSKAGYSMGDMIGKSGLEGALEPYLHGTAGARAVDDTLGGTTFENTEVGYEPSPGDNVITTIDLDLQQATERSLARNLVGYGRGGAAVVLDLRTSEVLTMASYPTYQLETFNRDYEQLLSDTRNPQINRATSGIYVPGSTFKLLSAVAALEEGVITGGTAYTCTGVFEYGGQKFLCKNHLQPMTLDVTQAIKYSCNTFFYQVGRRMGGERLEKWAAVFGLGKSTGIEVDEASGHAAGPTYREKMLQADPTLNPWLGGDDVQAAIGQSDHGYTPLQLANYLATLVGGGTLHRPTLVRSIKSYDYANVVQAERAETISKTTISQSTLDLVMRGMSEVTAEGGTAATVFANYPVKVGGKTGTAEMFERKNGQTYKYNNGLFVAFAPFDNPEIAVCVVGEGAEHGSSVAPIVRDIFNVYFGIENEDGQKVDTLALQTELRQVTSENTMLP